MGATIKHHFENTNIINKDNFRRNIYVDNIITGADNKEEANQLYQSDKRKFKEIILFKDDQMEQSKIKVLGLL